MTAGPIRERIGHRGERHLGLWLISIPRGFGNLASAAEAAPSPDCSLPRLKLRPTSQLQHPDSQIIYAARVHFVASLELLTAAEAIAEHEDAEGDQDQRPELLDSPPREPVEIVQEQQHADEDDERGTDGLALTETFERVVEDHAGLFGLCGAVGIDRHVNPQTRDADPKRGFRAAADGAINTEDEQEEKNREMDDAFAELLVVESAEAGQKSQEKCERGIWAGSGPHDRRRKRQRARGRVAVIVRGCGSSLRIRRLLRGRIRRKANHACEAIFTIENVADGAHANGAHRLAAISTKTCCVCLWVDGAIHGRLLAT